MDAVTLAERKFFGLADSIVEIGRTIAQYRPIGEIGKAEQRTGRMPAIPIASWSVKSDGSYVSGRDFLIDNVVQWEIRKISSAPIVSEESSPYDPFSSLYWLIDPWDGSGYDKEGFSELCSISVGLIRDNEAIAGIVVQPFLEQAYVCIKDKGVYQKVPRWNRPGQYDWIEFVPMKRSRLIGTDIPLRGKPSEAYLKEAKIVKAIFRRKSLNLPGVMGGIAVLRRMCDFYWSHTQHAWDVAGYAPMIERMGGVIEDLYNGGPIDWDWHALNPKAPIVPIIVAESAETAAAVRSQLTYYMGEQPSTQLLLT